MLRRLGRTLWAASELPKFYFPTGRPYSGHEIEVQLRHIRECFSRQCPTGFCVKKDFGTLLKACGIPFYWKEPLFNSVSNWKPSAPVTSNTPLPNKTHRYIRLASNNKKEPSVTCEAFVDYWKRQEKIKFLFIFLKPV